MLIANDQADPEMQKFEGGWIRRDLLVPGVTGGVSLPVWTLTPDSHPQRDAHHHPDIHALLHANPDAHRHGRTDRDRNAGRVAH